MLARVPDEITDPIVEGEFAIVDEQGAERVRSSSGKADEAASLGRALPVVTIGQPESELRLDLRRPHPDSDEHEYRLVRVSCSFRPQSRHESVDWARFSVQLLADESGHQPIAVDIHPLEQVQEVRRQVRLGISPTLTFKELEASVGSAEADVDYAELLPKVSGSGIGEATPSWDYDAVRGTHIAGTRVMHLLVRSPREMAVGTAKLEITADIVGAGFRIPVVFPRERSAGFGLEARLWD